MKRMLSSSLSMRPDNSNGRMEDSKKCRWLVANGQVPSKSQTNSVSQLAVHSYLSLYLCTSVCPPWCQPASFMSAFTTTTNTPLRQAWLRLRCSQAGRLALRDLDRLFQVCLGPSALRVPVSHSVLVVS